MKPRTPYFKVLLLLGLAAILSSTGQTAPAAKPVLAILSSNAAPYREHLEGFAARFGGEVAVKVLDADSAALAASLSQNPPGLVFTLGTSAADFVARHNPRPPLLFSMVYYPERHALVGRENVAGLSLRVPPAKVLEALELVRPRARPKLRIGLVYPENREDEELRAIREAVEKSGHLLALRRVGAGMDVGQTFQALLPEIDVLWLVADPAVLPGPEFLQAILRLALDKKVAVIGLSDAHVRSGALLAVSVDYRLEGEAAARLAARILQGENASTIGVLPPQNLVRSLNTRVAEELGWPVLRSTRQRFERVYP